MKLGNFAFGGEQRSASFPCFWAGDIPNSVVAVECPNVCCVMVVFQNAPESTGNIWIGSQRLGVIGSGIVLEPGQVSGVIPVQNVSLLWHKDSDVTSHLNYWIICCGAVNLAAGHNHILTEGGVHLLTEAGDRLEL